MMEAAKRPELAGVQTTFSANVPQFNVQLDRDKAKELGMDNEKVNPNGSGISPGHPVGATGAILVTKTIYELKCTGGRYALITMCIGDGQDIGMLIERV